ncbi:hypothetical protein CHUAL_008866 [Chamberlinius hualienensis]
MKFLFVLAVLCFSVNGKALAEDKPLTEENAVGQSAFTVIQAESFSYISGSYSTYSSCGATYISSLNNGDYLRYDNVDFGTAGARYIHLNLCSFDGSLTLKTVNVFLDTLSKGDPIATFDVNPTGSSCYPNTLLYTLNQVVTGYHSVFISIQAENQLTNVLDLNYFTFSS